MTTLYVFVFYLMALCFVFSRPYMAAPPPHQAPPVHMAGAPPVHMAGGPPPDMRGPPMDMRGPPMGEPRNMMGDPRGPPMMEQRGPPMEPEVAALMRLHVFTTYDDRTLC